jgi:hypothetical protein
VELDKEDHIQRWRSTDENARRRRMTLQHTIHRACQIHHPSSGDSHDHESGVIESTRRASLLSPLYRSCPPPVPHYRT